MKSDKVVCKMDLCVVVLQEAGLMLSFFGPISWGQRREEVFPLVTLASFPGDAMDMCMVGSCPKLRCHCVTAICRVWCLLFRLRFLFLFLLVSFRLFFILFFPSFRFFFSCLASFSRSFSACLAAFCMALICFSHAAWQAKRKRIRLSVKKSLSHTFCKASSAFFSASWAFFTAA